MKTPEQWYEDITMLIVGDAGADEFIPFIQAIQNDAVESTVKLMYERDQFMDKWEKEHQAKALAQLRSFLHNELHKVNFKH